MFALRNARNTRDIQPFSRCEGTAYRLHRSRTARRRTIERGNNKDHAWLWLKTIVKQLIALPIYLLPGINYVDPRLRQFWADRWDFYMCRILEMRTSTLLKHPEQYAHRLWRYGADKDRTGAEAKMQRGSSLNLVVSMKTNAQIQGMDVFKLSTKCFTGGIRTEWAGCQSRLAEGEKKGNCQIPFKMHDPGVKWTGFGSRLRGYQPLVWGMTGFQVISKILIHS